VRELLRAGHRKVREVWVADTVEGGDTDGPLSEIMALARAGNVPVRLVPRARLDAAAGTEAPQGVLAYAEAVADVELEELLRPGSNGPPPFLVVLDGITDPHNVGAILRSAVGAGATGAVMARHRAGRLGPAAVKAAAGAVEHLAMAVVPGVPNALQQMTRAGVTTIGLDADAALSLFSLTDGRRSGAGVDMAGPVALVIGAEGKGLALLTRKRCDLLVSIPQHGTIESLNVAAAGAVAFFEVARARAAERARAAPSAGPTAGG